MEYCPSGYTVSRPRHSLATLDILQRCLFFPSLMVMVWAVRAITTYSQVQL